MRRRLHVTLKYWYDVNTDDYPLEVQDYPKKMAELDFKDDATVLLESDSEIVTAMFEETDDA